MISLLLVFVLAVSFAAPVCGAVSEAEPEAPWYDSIPEMLAAGEYEEGVVVAGIDMSAAGRSGDAGSAPETAGLKEDAEELMYVDTEDTLTRNEFISWLKELVGSDTGRSDDGICIISIRRDDMTTVQMLRLLATDESVVFAEPNYIIDISAEVESPFAENGASAVSEEEPDVSEETGGPGTDTVPEEKRGTGSGDTRDVSGLQWSSSEDASMHTADKTGSVSIQVPGWPDGSNMDHEIIVAVLDMPVDYTHPDLKDVMYTFSPELKEKLGCDDHGFNAMWKSEDGKLDQDPYAQHGTHVAGILGAAWDGKGISGVASNVRIISVQAMDATGYSNLVDALRGFSFIKKAVENGVDIKIVNNSWGLAQSSKALDAAITELGEHGVICFFSCGNSAEDLNVACSLYALPEDNPYMILVAATTPAGTLADTSCFGKGIVTLGAPGVAILSSIPVGMGSYMPGLTSENKFYEDFEGSASGTSDEARVKICQIGYKTYTDEHGTEQIDPDPESLITGAEGIVVTGSSEMGFEGKNVLKVVIDDSALQYENGVAALRIDLGDVSDLDIQPGDQLGFAFGARVQTKPARIVDTASGSEPQASLYDSNKPDAFDYYLYTLEEGIDTEDLSFILELDTKGADEIYFDVFGIGNEEQPYLIASGTSMASPAAAGAGAVLASRHYDELSSLSPSESAKRLASIVRSSVRPAEDLKDRTSTGGIIDLSVDTFGTDPQNQPGPDITDMSCDGSTVTLSGTGFGENQGTVSVSRYKAGCNSDLEATVSSWSDSEVVLDLSENFEGILEVVLTSSGGRDTRVGFVSKSDDIFEEDHHLGSGTGGPLEFDEPGDSDDIDLLGDFETSGLLLAGDGSLYYLPRISKMEINPVIKHMYCYDPESDSWTACPDLPQWLALVSGAWLDGTLYIKGISVSTDDSGTIAFYDEEEIEETGTALIFSYAPGDSGWKECSAENVSIRHTLFATDTGLMLAGVTKEELRESEDGLYPGVREYDTESGAGEPLGYTSFAEANPKVVYADGYTYVCEYSAVNALHVFDSSMTETEDSISLPEFSYGDRILEGDGDGRLEEYQFSLTSLDDTLILVGPAAADGSSDTFILEAGETSFTPLDKRVSDAYVLMPSSAVMDGRLYVIAASNYEPDKRIFRSTLLEVPEAERFTITYDLNGGSYNGSTEAITEEYETGAVITIHEAPEREGYTFSYWKGSEYQPGDSYTVEEDHEFVAQWEKTPEPEDEGASGGTVPTGDISHTGDWIALLVLSLFALAAVLMYRRKRLTRSR